MIGEQRTLTRDELTARAEAYIAEQAEPWPLADTAMGRRILARLAVPTSADELAFELDLYPHEAEVLLRELGARRLVRRTPEGWVV